MTKNSTPEIQMVKRALKCKGRGVFDLFFICVTKAVPGAYYQISIAMKLTFQSNPIKHDCFDLEVSSPIKNKN